MSSKGSHPSAFLRKLAFIQFHNAKNFLNSLMKREDGMGTVGHGVEPEPVGLLYGGVKLLFLCAFSVPYIKMTFPLIMQTTLCFSDCGTTITMKQRKKNQANE